ncbi:MAG TPA: pyridoxamine 5'-phosphate oxidase family protein [Candidatus Kryptonia bacterium]|nr:pyridoxamine 5'-phosphate oxidase family protein [Candidatus Kryptonia bacterium]
MERLRDHEPQASRPYMPGYNLHDASDGRGLLPWSWAIERLTRAHNYWLATTRPEGLPHCMPVWGVWLDERFYFSSGRRSRKARNLAANPNCVVSTERADEAVILEGVAKLVTERAQLQPFYDAYQAKYRWDMEAMGEPIYVVRPVRAFGFTEAELTGTATRWTFDDVIR